MIEPLRKNEDRNELRSDYCAIWLTQTGTKQKRVANKPTLEQNPQLESVIATEQERIYDLDQAIRLARAVKNTSCALRLADAVQLSKIEEGDGYCKGLEELLSKQADNLWLLSDVITSTYFSHSQPHQQLSPQHQDEDI